MTDNKDNKRITETSIFEEGKRQTRTSNRGSFRSSIMGSTIEDDGIRYLRKHGSLTSRSATEPQLKFKMETKIRGLVKKFKGSGKKDDFPSTLFAKHWMDSVEHHIEYIAKHTKKGKLEKVVKHFWRTFVEDVSNKPIQNNLISLVAFNDIENGDVVLKYSYPNSDTHYSSAKVLPPLKPTEKWRHDKSGDFLYNVKDKSRRFHTSIFEAWLNKTGSRRSTVKTEDLNDPIESVVFLLDKSYFNREAIIEAPPYAVQKLAHEPSIVEVQITLKPTFSPRKISFKHQVTFDAGETSSYIKIVANEKVITRKKSIKGKLLNRFSKGRKSRMREIILKIGNDYALIESITSPNLKDAVKAKMAKKAETISQSFKTGEEIASSALVMKKFTKEKEEGHRFIALGSIMSSILHGSTTQLNFDSFDRCYESAKKRLRYIVLDDETINAGFSRFMHKGLKNRLQDEVRSPLSLSRSCDEIDDYRIDFFVSHCWRDDVDTKILFLIQFSKEFFRKEKRYPRLWIDLFCVDQDVEELATNIELLPVFLMACQKVLLLRSNILTTRLWCLMEIYSRAAMSNSDDKTGARINIIEVEKIKHEHIDCNKAHCAFKKDSELLRKKLDNCPGGISRVNKVIIEALGTAELLNISLEETI